MKLKFNVYIVSASACMCVAAYSQAVHVGSKSNAQLLLLFSHCIPPSWGQHLKDSCKTASGLQENGHERIFLGDLQVISP